MTRVPEWARPRDRERHGLGSLRLAETTVLILFGLFLAIATVNDVVQQTHVNHRLVADLRTWRETTGQDYRNLGTEQDVKGHTTRDTVCGNVSPGGPRERTQVCLVLVGSPVAVRIEVSGGYYLPPKTEDERRSRYGCFGATAQAGLCGMTRPPVGSPPAPALPTGRG
jgi:cell division protein FtsL